MDSYQAAMLTFTQTNWSIRMANFSLHITNETDDSDVIDFKNHAQLQELLKSRGDKINEFHSFLINDKKVIYCEPYQRRAFLETVGSVVEALEQ